MNNINSWKMFLELRSGTYRNAAIKAKKYKQYKLSKDFDDMGDIKSEEEFEHYYDKINKMKKHTYTIYSYKKQDENGYYDITKEEKVNLDSIILTTKDDDIEFLMYYMKENDQYENVLKTYNDMDILQYDYLEFPFKFATRKEAKHFVKEFLEIYSYYEELMIKTNNNIKELKLNVRDWYDTDLPEQLLKQDLDKFDI